MTRTEPRKQIHGKIFIAALLGAVSFGAVLVQTIAADAATEEQKAACTPDVWRLCSSEVPNVSRIVACLNRNHGKLSAACKVVMDGGSSRKTAGR